MSAKRTVTAVEQTDHRITDRVNTRSDSWPIRVLGVASEIGDQPQMRAVCVATTLVGMVQRDRRLAATGLKMLAAHSLATWVKSRIKATIDRTRPESGDDPHMRPGRSDRHEDNSFPSGHSAGAMAVGEAFARAYPDRRTAARGAALAVSIVQVPRGTHYAGDVLAGIAIGVVAERLSDGAIRFAERRIGRTAATREIMAPPSAA
ncbi:hypothetical protein GCM10011380_32010 [Sphingomonas metalli]|uniref:Phosphatidic acid phosphatase type 2/haloperoxidase domain-containing protein n=1 Tax=Sphingomonas metalli TaxID=1779358 RepID=A0A916TDR7_9SPHN|nr:phosphatase PAP2 family protein [Sphingomonas metalli]GGB40153.1 hypothetical protein GCM10011380_32010 [Sphingomonas metalli]